MLKDHLQLKYLLKDHLNDLFLDPSKSGKILQLFQQELKLTVNNKKEEGL